ncbi:MAG: GNAT family N-acetyltransferase [Flavobacteriaceae bacterium]
MIKIKAAKQGDIHVLALLGRLTFTESHGHFIDDKNDLLKYLDENFSVSKMKLEINDPKNLFYIVYADSLPVGYAKIVVNARHESVVSQNSCRLQRIFILDDFIPLKIGQQLLTFVEEKAKELGSDTIWLSVYIKNNRAIRFYERNEFKNVGELNFLVNRKAYENIVFSKII